MDCKVECRENQFFIVGTFQCLISVSPGGQELDQIEAGKRESSKPGSHSNANAHGMFLKVLTNWLPKLRIHSKAAPFLGSMTYRQRKYGLPLRVAGLRTGDIVQSCSTGLGLWGLRSAAKNAQAT
ncbi:MAG: hypothetical protein FWD31_07720 [Planctomycetaceae bacterium]|nr:hypothetical protein [Planctomycetaceae bacterium]